MHCGLLGVDLAQGHMAQEHIVQDMGKETRR